MDKFTITQNGYSPEEVNYFFDAVIKKMESLVRDNKEKTNRIIALQERLREDEESLSEIEALREKVHNFEQLEETLNKAIIMAQKTADQMRAAAHDKSEVIVNEAKNNANRIINEALIETEKIQRQNDLLRRNMIVFKKRVRGVIETQLDVVNDMDNIDFE